MACFSQYQNLTLVLTQYKNHFGQYHYSEISKSLLSVCPVSVCTPSYHDVDRNLYQRWVWRNQLFCDQIWARFVQVGLRVQSLHVSLRQLHFWIKRIPHVDQLESQESYFLGKPILNQSKLLKSFLRPLPDKIFPLSFFGSLKLFLEELPVSQNTRLTLDKTHYTAYFSYGKACSFQKRNPEEKNSETFQRNRFDRECKNLLRERQLAYEKYSKISSPENCSAYSKLRSTLSSVVKEKREQFPWNCFISLKSSKDRWSFMNNVRGQSQSVNIAASKNS